MLQQQNPSTLSTSPYVPRFTASRSVSLWTLQGSIQKGARISQPAVMKTERCSLDHERGGDQNSGIYLILIFGERENGVDLLPFLILMETLVKDTIGGLFDRLQPQ